MSAALPEMGPATVLPSVREEVSLLTGDGVRLVGELASPVGVRPVATLVTLHPLPTAGGMMDSHVFRKAANRLPALADVAVLGFNTHRAPRVRMVAARVLSRKVTTEHFQHQGRGLICADP